MNEYGFNQAKHGTHKIILSFLEEKKLVLDVGCQTGYLGANDIKNNTFYGIEKNKKAAKKAEKIYRKVITGDVEKLINTSLELPKFDVIIFADILEHLVYPKKTLSFFVKNFLKSKGKVIISLPNVAHITVRLNLLLGNFDYTRSGILDKTHLRLYTLKSAQKLINNSGLKIESIAYSSNRFGYLIGKMPFLGKLLGFNLIFLCAKNENSN